MSIKNRNEIATQVTTKIVPEVSNADHIDLLNNDIVNSVLTRKDVINAAVPVGGALTVSYAEGLNSDTVTATLTESTAVTFTGLENGDVKYLKITKAAGYAVTFVGTTNETHSQDYIDVNLTSVLYAVYQKNGVNHVKAITKSNISTTTKVPFVGTWNMDIEKIFAIAIPIPFDDIINVSVFIKQTGDTVLYPIGGELTITSITQSGGGASVLLDRVNGGFFDSASFNNVTGWAAVEYLT